MDALTSLRVPIKLFLMVREEIGDARKAFFEVPTKRKGEKPILFERIESEPIACESSGSRSESPQFFHYKQKSCHMMERMRYDLTKGLGLISAKKSEHYFVHLYQGKNPPSTITRLREDWVIYFASVIRFQI